MAAHEKEMLDQQRLAQGQLGAWQFLAKFALWPKAVTASVQRMARRIEDLEAERDNVAAERDQLALRLAGWEDGGNKKTVEEASIDRLIEPVMRCVVTDFRSLFRQALESVDRCRFGAAERRLRSDGIGILRKSMGCSCPAWKSGACLRIGHVRTASSAA